MTCKDCIHYNVCVIVEHRVDEDEDYLTEFGCEDFLDKNDVVEVKHARWIVSEFCGGNRIGFCTECGVENRIDNYCPNCGAKMDEVEDGV